jgi:hypothetical protein
MESQQVLKSPGFWLVYVLGTHFWPFQLFSTTKSELPLYFPAYLCQLSAQYQSSIWLGLPGKVILGTNALLF